MTQLFFIIALGLVFITAPLAFLGWVLVSLGKLLQWPLVLFWVLMDQLVERAKK